MKFMDTLTRHPSGSAIGGRFAARRYGDSNVSLPATTVDASQGLHAFRVENGNVVETDPASLVAELAPVVAALDGAGITGPVAASKSVKSHWYADDIDWSRDNPGEMMSYIPVECTCSAPWGHKRTIA